MQANFDPKQVWDRIEWANDGSGAVAAERARGNPMAQASQ